MGSSIEGSDVQRYAAFWEGVMVDHNGGCSIMETSWFVSGKRGGTEGSGYGERAH